MKVTGTITKVMPIQEGVSKADKPWKKLSFVLTTTEEYNNLYCFDVFGEEKVENFTKYNKEGDLVDVDFNVKTNEWKDKYFTSLDAWKIFKSDGETKAPEAPANNSAESDDLPF